MVALDAIVEVVRAAMLRRWEELAQRGRLCSGTVRGDPRWLHVRAVDGPLEEAASRSSVAPPGEEDIYHLSMRVNGAGAVRPLSVEATRGLIHPPVGAENSVVNQAARSSV